MDIIEIEEYYHGIKLEQAYKDNTNQKAVHEYKIRIKQANKNGEDKKNDTNNLLNLLVKIRTGQQTVESIFLVRIVILFRVHF